MGELQIKKIRRATRLAVDDRPITIGRSPDNTVVLGASAVSRRHCVVELVDGVVRIRDLGSRGGTKVNEQRITESELNDGDRITVGGYELTYVTDPQGAADNGAERRRLLEQLDGQAAELSRLRVQVADQELEIEHQHQAETAALNEQIDLLLGSQLEATERAAGAEQMFAQCSSDLRELQEAWQRLAAIHRTLGDVESAWLETDQRAREAVSVGPTAVEQRLEERQVVTDQLTEFHAAHDAALADLQAIVQRLDRHT